MIHVMTWHREVGAWLQWLRASGSPTTTLRLRRWQIEHVSRELGGIPPWAVGTDDLTSLLGAPDWAPETRRSMRSAIRSFYSWATETGRIKRDPALCLPSVRIPRALPRPVPRPVARATLAATEGRVHLMVALALLAGLRRAEIAAVHSGDLVPDLTGHSLRVRGKGGKERLVPLPDDLTAAIAGHDGHLFPGQIDGHLSAQYVGKLISAALPGKWTAHTLRHYYASAAYAERRDLRTVQELLGHASPATTARYTAIPDGALRSASEAVAASLRTLDIAA